MTLADVSGMAGVRRAPRALLPRPAAQTPELRELYGKSLRGGLLLYGLPGCGKTYLARAIAGELGAAFFAVGLTDVLDMWLGQSEQKLHAIFVAARRKAPWSSSSTRSTRWAESAAICATRRGATPSTSSWQPPPA